MGEAGRDDATGFPDDGASQRGVGRRRRKFADKVEAIERKIRRENFEDLRLRSKFSKPISLEERDDADGVELDGVEIRGSEEDRGHVITARGRPTKKNGNAIRRRAEKKPRVVISKSSIGDDIPIMMVVRIATNCHSPAWL